MRKLFTTLKSVVAAAIVASMTLAASCSYDDSAINDRVDRVEQDLDQVTTDLAALTERVNALEQRLTEEVANLTALINGKVVVTGLEADGNGTKVTLSDGSSFTVYPECTVEDTDTDTNTTVAPYKHTDGVYYWAIFNMGEFVKFLEIDGEMVPLYDGNDYEDGECDNPYTPEAPVAPQFRVNAETGNIEVSIDGGATWVESGLSAAATGMQVFTGVADNGDGTVTFTLFDGSTLDVVKAELIEFNTTRGQLYVKPGETKEITFTINDAVADVNVMNQPLGWKAEVALAENNESEEGDDVDPGMGIMAAGGTDFVLKVTGPSQDFINAGYAETSGFISVHFNSANGACKVGKIAVEMASITLDVDKAGNVTVVSTWVDEYLYSSSWEGESLIQEFNNYYVTIMPIDYYVEDLASIWNDSWWEWDVPAVAGWINNFFYNVNEEFNTFDKATYVEGENEKWEFKATVEEIISVLDWSGSLTYEGNSFMVLVIPTDPQEYGALMIDQALAVPFKQLVVKAEVAETTWNNAYLNVALRGANAYQFNIENKAVLENQLEQGWYGDGATIDDYYRDYIFYWQNYGSSFGSHRITTDVAAENISFNDLINYGEEYPYLYELAPNTTYIVAILAEEDGKTEYTPEDLVKFEFTTGDVVAAATPFEYTIVRDDEQTDYFRIFANVTVPETAVAVYSAWSDEEFLSDDELKDYLINNGWAKVDFSEGYTYELNTTADSAGDEKYLYIMIVDAEGNYSMGSALLASKSVVVNENVNLTIEKVEFLTEGGVANVTLGGLEGVEYSYIKSYVCATDGYEYYLRTEDDLQDLAYGDDYLYMQYDTNPFTVTRTGDYKYVATEGKTYIVAVAVQFADGTVSKTVYQEIPFTAGGEEPAAADYNVTFTAVENLGEGSDYYCDSFYTFKFTNDEGQWLKLAVVTSALVDGALPTGDFEITWDGQYGMYGNATTICKELFSNMSYDPYITAGNVVISKTDDVYTVVVNGKDMYIDGVSGKTLKATFEGAINGAGDDVEDGVIAMTSMGAMEKIGSFSAGVLLSDDSGNNQVKLAVDEYYSWDSTNNFPKANAYDKYVSSPSYIMDDSDFSFVNKTLVVNGTTYASDEVTAATLTVVENTSITITFTVAGEEYTFQYNK